MSVTITGTAGDDTIRPGFVSPGVTGGVPGPGNDTILGLGGNDSLDGGGGDDSLNGGAGTNTLIGGAGNDTLNATAGFMDDVSGGEGDDVLLGPTTSTGQTSRLNPGLGNDTIQGNGLFDTRVEYAHYDRVAFVPRTETLVAVLGAIGTATLGAEVDTLLNVVNIRGTNQSDQFTGSAANEFFMPGRGNDTVDGRGGTDRVEYGDLTFGITLDLAAGQVLKGAQTDTLISIEDATGTAFADHIIGGAGNNVFRPFAGADTVDGGNGYDTVRYT